MSDIQLYIVPTPIGNLEDMTFRAIATLKSVDVVLAEDTRTSGRLLKHFDISKPMWSYHNHNEATSTSGVLQEMDKGKTFALISDAGTPGVSDPGFLLVRAMHEKGFRASTLPGATALIPALVNSGFPINRFTFEGFLPPKKGRLTKLKALQDENRTMLFYESPHRLLKLLEQMIAVFGEDRPVCVCREISKLYEETLISTLKKMWQHFDTHKPKGEFVVVLHGLSH